MLVPSVWRSCNTLVQRKGNLDSLLGVELPADERRFGTSWSLLSPWRRSYANSYQRFAPRNVLSCAQNSSAIWGEGPSEEGVQWVGEARTVDEPNPETIDEESITEMSNDPGDTYSTDAILFICFFQIIPEEKIINVWFRYWWSTYKYRWWTFD